MTPLSYTDSLPDRQGIQPCWQCREHPGLGEKKEKKTPETSPAFLQHVILLSDNGHFSMISGGKTVLNTSF